MLYACEAIAPKESVTVTPNAYWPGDAVGLPVIAPTVPGVPSNKPVGRAPDVTAQM